MNNIDTDLQFCIYWRYSDYMVKNIDYLKTQIATLKVLMFQTRNTHDPGLKMVTWKELTFNTRLEQAFADLNNVNTL
jgi:fructose-bisphosphate aldolase class II